MFSQQSEAKSIKIGDFKKDEFYSIGTDTQSPLYKKTIEGINLCSFICLKEASERLISNYYNEKYNTNYKSLAFTMYDKDFNQQTIQDFIVKTLLEDSDVKQNRVTLTTSTDNEYRKVFLVDMGGEYHHSAAIAYLKQGQKEAILYAESTSKDNVLETFLNDQIKVFVVDEPHQADYFSCHTYALILGRDITAKTKENQYRLPGLLTYLEENSHEKLPTKDEPPESSSSKGVFKAMMPPALLKPNQISESYSTQMTGYRRILVLKDNPIDKDKKISVVASKLFPDIKTFDSIKRDDLVVYVNNEKLIIYWKNDKGIQSENFGDTNLADKIRSYEKSLLHEETKETPKMPKIANLVQDITKQIGYTPKTTSLIVHTFFLAKDKWEEETIIKFRERYQLSHESAMEFEEKTKKTSSPGYLISKGRKYADIIEIQFYTEILRQMVNENPDLKLDENSLDLATFKKQAKKCLKDQVQKLTKEEGKTLYAAYNERDGLKAFTEKYLDEKYRKYNLEEPEKQTPTKPHLTAK